MHRVQLDEISVSSYSFAEIRSFDMAEAEKIHEERKSRKETGPALCAARM